MDSREYDGDDGKGEVSSAGAGNYAVDLVPAVAEVQSGTQPKQLRIAESNVESEGRDDGGRIVGGKGRREFRIQGETKWKCSSWQQLHLAIVPVHSIPCPAPGGESWLGIRRAGHELTDGHVSKNRPSV